VPEIARISDWASPCVVKEFFYRGEDAVLNGCYTTLLNLFERDVLLVDTLDPGSVQLCTVTGGFRLLAPMLRTILQDRWYEPVQSW